MQDIDLNVHYGFAKCVAISTTKKLPHLGSSPIN
jgi:hypothetical protein